MERAGVSRGYKIAPMRKMFEFFSKILLEEGEGF
jgi:hypothetical protein